MRRTRPVLAWAVGAAIYVAAAASWGGYDGLSTLMVVPACAAVVGAAAVGLVLAIGHAARTTPLWRAWAANPLWAALTAGCGVALLTCGAAAGLTGTYSHPDTGETFVAVHPAAALGGYALVVFAVAHWPANPLEAGWTFNDPKHES
jgi:hypothetical protein